MRLNTKFLLAREIGISHVTFEPATLKEWPTGRQIEYRVINPDSGFLEKKRMRFEKQRKRLGEKLARKEAHKYCTAINKELENGWNPYLVGKNVKSFYKLTEVLSTYLTFKEQDLANGVFSVDSMRSYKSQINMLEEHLRKTGNKAIHVGRFSKEMAISYLDHVYIGKKLSPRSYNNYIRTLRTVWNWFIEKNYCSENPFGNLKPKPEKEKERTVITPEWDEKILEYCRAYNPPLEIVCGLVYNSFMRPAEICRTQIKDIDSGKSAIFLPAAKTKTKTSRWCLLPPWLFNMVKKHAGKASPEDYLISTLLLPGKTPICTRRLDKYWEKMRKKINLPKTMKLYSYRDTGITDLKKQGHSNLFISTITGHKNSEEIETYTHEPDVAALSFVIEKSMRLGERK
ncbi:MAG: site-specific integrase [Dysgonamonadaceae bacterium]|jgi:integrase|nr:site-specific integrase [Dysgonamonadaceae bacterium]